MGKFVLKAALYFIILAVLISGAVFFVKSRSPKEFFFASNSLTHNLKVGFIRSHFDKFKNARIYVIGSSMSMNNIDAVMLQDSLHAPTLNLASWGLRIANFKDAPLWREDKLLIYDTQYADFRPTDITFMQGYRFDVSNMDELSNIFTDFRTYLSQQSQAKEFSAKTNKDYDYCKFDSCGSALLSDSGFYVKARRWNLDEFKRCRFDTSKLTSFVKDLKSAIGPQPNKVRVVLAFSPGRRVFYSEERARIVLKFADKLKKSCPNVIFLNFYNENWPDDMFVDDCHMNRKGAARFTKEIIDTIKADKIRY